MKKTRTIKMYDGYAYYRNIRVGKVSSSIKDHFRIPPEGKLKITVEENGPYKLMPLSSPISFYYRVSENLKLIGLVCREHFDRLFFRPDGRKRYNITVKRVKK